MQVTHFNRNPFKTYELMVLSRIFFSTISPRISSVAKQALSTLNSFYHSFIDRQFLPGGFANPNKDFCFVSALLQVYFGAPSAAPLFDPEAHPLQRGPEESEERFADRQELQRLFGDARHVVLGGHSYNESDRIRRLLNRITPDIPPQGPCDIEEFSRSFWQILSVPPFQVVVEERQFETSSLCLNGYEQSASFEHVPFAIPFHEGTKSAALKDIVLKDPPRTLPIYLFNPHGIKAPTRLALRTIGTLAQFHLVGLCKYDASPAAHYTATVKHSVQGEPRWVWFSDTSVGFDDWTPTNRGCFFLYERI